MPNARNNWRLIVGLTGGIGSGKSTVLSMMKKKGAFVLDADAIVRDLFSNNKLVQRRIIREFGTLDKKELAKIVFHRQEKRKLLEKILHPLVRKEIWISLETKRGDIAVLDIPLLFESHWQDQLDQVVVVKTNIKNRIQRLKKKGVSATDAKQRMAAQWPLQKKVALADFVIDNNGSINQTQHQVNAVWKKLMKQGSYYQSSSRTQRVPSSRQVVSRDPATNVQR